MRLFDTNVQQLKYLVLKEIVSLFNNSRLDEGLLDIPEKIMPGPKATMRCCIYKERAIVSERVKLAMGQGEHKGRAVEVLGIACDECPVTRFSVSESCRGCIAHRCSSACPVGAISFEKQKAVIDHNKCLECGKCKKVCPYNAIIESQRPCIKGCTAKAISLDDQKKAKINYEKCIACGNCVYQCPFGAIVDKSYILDVLKMLKQSPKDNYKVYAIIAPSIISQFSYAKIGQIVTGIKRAGFHSVVEVALGADMTSVKEADELNRKGKLTSSCCPAFVKYIKTNYPNLTPIISENASPMIEIAKLIKVTDRSSKVVFIGPCIAKKEEFQKEEVSEVIDSVLTFEELQALFDGLDIKIEQLPEETLDNASYYGRIFARSGGLTEAVNSIMNDKYPDFEFKPQICDGLEQCKVALLKANSGKAAFNFVEGMACEGGCIGGAGCLHHGAGNRNDVDKYGKQAFAKTIKDSLDVLNSLRKD